MGMNNQQAVTTLALRGISKNYTVRTVQYFLDTACGDFEWKRYNFLYLPRRGHSHSGLAIVNFIDAQSCATCEWHLRLLQSEGAMSGIKSIGESYIQGFAQNLAYYAALVSEDARDVSHVLVLDNGKPADINRMIRRYVTPTMMQWAVQQRPKLYIFRTSGHHEALYRSPEKGKEQGLSLRISESSEECSDRDDRRSHGSAGMVRRHGSTSDAVVLPGPGFPRARVPTDEEAEQIRRYFRLQRSSDDDFVIFSL
eukprot:s635_g30.t1